MLTLDWCSLSFETDDLEQVKTCLSELFGNGSESHGVQGYRKGMRYACGACISWESAYGDDFGTVSITGDSCDVLGVRGVVDLMRESWVLRCTRIDTRFSDRKGLLDWSYFIDARNAGNYSGLRSTRIIDKQERSGPSVLKIRGQSIYYGNAGRRGSGAMLNFYNETAESGVVVGRRAGVEFCAWAFEMRFYQGKAESLRTELLKAGKKTKKIRKVIAGAMLDPLSFLDRSSGDKNLNRCPELQWWTRFKKAVKSSKVDLKGKVNASTYDESWHHFKRQASGTLRALYMCRMNDDEFAEHFMEMVKSAKLGPRIKDRIVEWIEAEPDRAEICRVPSKELPSRVQEYFVA